MLSNVFLRRGHRGRTAQVIVVQEVKSFHQTPCPARVVVDVLPVVQKNLEQRKEIRRFKIAMSTH